MVSKEELPKMISDITKEIMNKNAKVFEEEPIKTIDITVQLSVAVTIEILEKLGVIDKVIK